MWNNTWITITKQFRIEDYYFLSTSQGFCLAVLMDVNRDDVSSSKPVQIFEGFFKISNYLHLHLNYLNEEYEKLY
jgi:hypothetical protein